MAPLRETSKLTRSLLVNAPIVNDVLIAWIYIDGLVRVLYLQRAIIQWIYRDRNDQKMVGTFKCKEKQNSTLLKS